MRRSISKKLTGLFAVFTAGGIVALVAFYWFLFLTRGDAAFINISGRQRMLSQLILNQALQAASGPVFDPVTFSYSINTFEESLNALEHGGNVLGHYLPPPPGDLVQPLQKVREHWSSIKPLLARLGRRSTPKAERARIAGHLQADLPHLTDLSDRIVTTYQDRRERLRARNLYLLVGISLLDLLILTVGFFTTRRTILKPIRNLLEATLRIQKGDFSPRLAPTSQDEFSDLASSFNEMAGELNRVAASNRLLIEQARRATKEREEVVAVVSHDLKNPLSAVRLNLALLRKLLFRSRSHFRRKYLANLLDRAEASTDSAFRLTDDLLDLARLESGAFPLEIRDADLSKVLSGVAAIFAPIAEHKHIRLRTDAPPGVRIAIDPHRINQAVSNLVANAIKYTPEDGEVTLELRKEDSRILISVSDTGPGIPEEYQSRIFDRYWQPHETHRRGAGLGLFIAKEIAIRHHGKISVESEVGKGSKFTIELPAAGAKSGGIQELERKGA